MLSCDVCPSSKELQGKKLTVQSPISSFHQSTEEATIRELRDETRMSRTRDLGCYLGAQFIHQQCNKGIYAELISRFNKRLSGWKSRCLSMAGKIMLAKSVLQSFPVFQMRTMKLPKSVTKGMNKITRDFVWGCAQQRRKVHHVKWDQICKPT